MKHHILFARQANLERTWPFVAHRLETRLTALGDLTVINVDVDTPLSEVVDLTNVVAIAYFGGRLTESCIARSLNLRLVGAVLDGTGLTHVPVDCMLERDIALIDATCAWSSSVAECTLALAINALRRIPQWHRAMAEGKPLWEFEYAQFCDPPNFVNGTLGTKTVGVIGLGQIGGRVAAWCNMLGARVMGYDPFVSRSRLEELGTEPVEIDQLVDTAEIIFVAVPPTPSARHLLSRERIDRLGRGALVVITTRAHAVDMDALRRRIMAGELAGAFDVYDVEPLPVDDPLRGRDNVVHVPHIAGRTKNANLSVADTLADDFARVLRGEQPRHRLSRVQIAVRSERADLPPMAG